MYFNMAHRESKEKLKNAAIPDTVASIGSFALSVSGLTDVTIPGGVTEIGLNALAYPGETTQMLKSFMERQ